MPIESVMPSNHLILCHPLLPSFFPSIRVFSNESALHQVAKVLGLQLHVSPSSEYSGLISFRSDWSSCCPRDSEESSPAPQFESIHSSALSLVYRPTLTSVHTYWENHCSDYMDLCGQSCVCFLICWLGLS